MSSGCGSLRCVVSAASSRVNVVFISGFCPGAAGAGPDAKVDRGGPLGSGGGEPCGGACVGGGGASWCLSFWGVPGWMGLFCSLVFASALWGPGIRGAPLSWLRGGASLPHPVCIKLARPSGAPLRGTSGPWLLTSPHPLFITLVVHRSSSVHHTCCPFIIRSSHLLSVTIPQFSDRRCDLQ